MRDNSDVRFAFVTGGKDPDEVLKSGGESAMRKIIDSATPLIDFLWQTINKNYIVSTPGGRSQAEKFLKSQIEKITDIDFRREIENEYDTRKFNEWHKWRKNKDNAPQIELPAIDEMTKKTLVYIVNTYPELVERYGEFLSGLNIDFDSEIVTDAKLDLKSSEKYIVSLKLNIYIDKLKNDRTALIQMALAGDSSAKDQIIKIDSDIASANEKLENLMNIE